jgi:predicted Zn-dependent protease
MTPRSLRNSAERTGLTREEAQALANKTLGFSTADACRVNINSGWQGNTRFADSGITTSGGVTDTTVTITSTIGRRRASAQTNVLEDGALRRTVELSERLARLAPEDPELMPDLDGQSYAPVNAFAQSTADLTPEARALAAKRIIQRAGETASAAGDVAVAGFLEVEAGSEAVANKRGLFAYHPNTEVNLSTTVRTPDGTGSGWASTGSRRWTDIEPVTLGVRAAQKAVASRNPQAIEPGQYTVILEPQAVADLIPSLMGSFNARNADEGRSAFSKRGGGSKVGEKIADERVTLYSDPTDPDLLAQPFNDEGLPVPRTVWIENGILKNLAYSRYWAARQGKQPTGGGGGGGGFGGGTPGGLKMVGGTQTTEELIAGTERGILVTHFFYIRFLDQRTVMLTGLTRDGLFLVEKGKVTRSLKNFRWNESPLFVLNKIEAIGRAERTAAGQMMPSLKVRDFNFTSLSDAV